jgi:flagellar hook-associated protein 3 FlgL
MRITNNMMINRSLSDINANLVRVDRVQRDISTGKRIHRPSDDPTANARAMVLRTNMAQNEQYSKNIAEANNFMAVTDTALGSITDTVLRLRNRAVQGASGHWRDEDRKAIIGEVKQLREELRAIGNTQVNGRYIFGGLKTQTEPLPSDVTFGPNDNGKLPVEIGPGITMNYNVTSVEIFGDTTPPSDAHFFEVIDEFVDLMEDGTSTQDISTISLKGIDDWMNRIKDLRTDVGGKVNRLEMAQTRLEDISISLESLLRDTEDTDITEASLRLNQYEATFQAALSVGARAIPLSLVDFLR